MEVDLMQSSYNNNMNYDLALAFSWLTIEEEQYYDNTPPSVYASVTITNEAEYNSFLDTLDKRRELGPLVKELCLGSQIDERIELISRRCPNLKGFPYFAHLEAAEFAMTHCGAWLKRLHVYLDRGLYGTPIDVAGIHYLLKKAQEARKAQNIEQNIELKVKTSMGNISTKFTIDDLYHIGTKVSYLQLDGHEYSLTHGELTTFAPGSKLEKVKLKNFVLDDFALLKQFPAMWPKLNVFELYAILLNSTDDDDKYRGLQFLEELEEALKSRGVQYVIWVRDEDSFPLYDSIS